MNESETIAAARGGEERAYRALYDAHVDRAFRIAFRMVGDEAVASDILQEAFVKAFRGLATFRGDAAFGTWLHRIVVTVALAWLKKSGRRRDRRDGLFPDGPPTPTERPSSDPHLRDRLERAIDGLSDLYRTVFLMHDLEGFTHKEIAEALGVAVGTSKARLSRARAQLREAMGDAVREHVR